MRVQYGTGTKKPSWLTNKREEEKEGGKFKRENSGEVCAPSQNGERGFFCCREFLCTVERREGEIIIRQTEKVEWKGTLPSSLSSKARSLLDPPVQTKLLTRDGRLIFLSFYSNAAVPFHLFSPDDVTFIWLFFAGREGGWRWRQ